MSVSREEVLRVARLARIHLSEEEVERFQGKFAAILEHFAFLREADTDGVEPLFHAQEQMELRADAPQAPIDRDALLVNAPESLEHSFKIPRILGAVE